MHYKVPLAIAIAIVMVIPVSAAISAEASTHAAGAGTTNDHNSTHGVTSAVPMSTSGSPGSGSNNSTGGNSTLFYTFSLGESGLPAGTTWYLNITGVSTFSTTSANISVSLPNGTYSYRVSSSDNKYSPQTPTGSITVNGANVSGSVKFSKVTYGVTFTESGLPAGTNWYVNTSSNSSGPIKGPSYTMQLSNGTYSYSAASADNVYSAPSGKVSVNGAGKSVSVNFTKTTYKVNAYESGLPSGTKWFFNVSGGNSYSSTSNSLSFNAPNGTYTATYSSTNSNYKGGSASFTVSGSSTKVLLNFSTEKYPVTVSESGLPSGTKWFYNVSGGNSYSSTSSSLTFNATNGSYSASYSSASSSYKSGSSSFKVNGSPTSVKVNFTSEKYQVTVKETGLPSGTTWYFNISGGSKSGPISGPSYTTNLSNGSYSYTVSSSGNVYRASSPSGSFKVSGNPASVSVKFIRQTYKVTFKESGLPSGNWFVNLSGIGSSGPIYKSSYSVMLSNGSYSFNISSTNSQYAPSYSNTFTVNGSSATTNITFIKSLLTVRINESGLPKGMRWNASINGLKQTTNKSHMTVNVQSGNYTILFANTTDFYSTVHEKNVSVSNSSRTVNTTYMEYAFLNASVNPANAIATINGKNVSMKNGTFNLTLTNGTYHLVVKKKGYQTYNENMTLNSGQAKDINITLNSSASHHSGPALPDSPLLYIIIGVVAAAGATAGAILWRRKMW